MAGGQSWDDSDNVYSPSLRYESPGRGRSGRSGREFGGRGTGELVGSARQALQVEREGTPLGATVETAGLVGEVEPVDPRATAGGATTLFIGKELGHDFLSGSLANQHQQSLFAGCERDAPSPTATKLLPASAAVPAPEPVPETGQIGRSKYRSRTDPNPTTRRNQIHKPLTCMFAARPKGFEPLTF